MNEQAMISVIIPVYNAEAYISECIESIIHQTYHNLQIIVVNDGSRDNSRQICEKYAEQDSRVILMNQKHAGVSKARNKALYVAKGKYITFVDSDDWLEPIAYETVLNDMITHKVEVVFYGFYKESSRKQYDTVFQDVGLCGKEEMLRQTIIPKGYMAECWSKMFDRELIFHQGNPILFDESLTNGEDGLWTWTVLSNAVCAYLNNMKLYHYRVRDDGANFNKIMTRKRLSELEAYKKAYEIVFLVSPDLLTGIKARTFNCAHELRIKSYIQNNRECEQICVKVMEETADIFYKSSYFNMIYKIHHWVMDFLIAVHIPRKIINYIVYFV